MKPTNEAAAVVLQWQTFVTSARSSSHMNFIHLTVCHYTACPTSWQEDASNKEDASDDVFWECFQLGKIKRLILPLSFPLRGRVLKWAFIP